MALRVATLACLAGSALAGYSENGSPLVRGSGQKAAIPTWDIQSSSSIKKNAAALSHPGADVSSWHHIDASRCTLMGCLLKAGVYKEEELWYSDNLEGFNWEQFNVPWFYRNEFSLQPGKGKHFILETNGITPKADLYINGEQIANKKFQAGGYGGHRYDITPHVASKNALVVQTQRTDYMYDFALGFVDWNPYPPDNGTGVWRDITVKETGSIALNTLSVLTTLNTPVGDEPATVTLRTVLQNLEKHKVKSVTKAAIKCPQGKILHRLHKSVTLGPGETKTLELTESIADPKIWWPRFWGDQPLYSVEVSSFVDSKVSDSITSTFGLRNITSVVEKDDRLFSVNGHPFQVIGGGYSSDMFLRWDGERFSRIADYMLDMGLNTIRLEGKMEQSELYEIADKIGLMVLPGWECCNHWERWTYNDELAGDPGPPWGDNDYQTAKASMEHEASMLQTHPSIIGFLAGSDFWPDERATDIYVDALEDAGWQVPVVCSASKRGFSKRLGPSGMKMDGPYDWVPPNYWYDTKPYKDRLGAAFGFGSELGSGVGTPEIGSLKKFLSEKDMKDLWQHPNKGLYHMSTNVSSFYDREIYNEALFSRYGKPTSLDDYLIKAQMMDYEATRAQHEGFSSLWNAARRATGTIYWMLNNAWPSLHWNQFDHYLHPAGSYFGTKVGSRLEHVAYDYVSNSIYLINHSIDKSGPRSVDVEIVGVDGKRIAKKTKKVNTKPNTSTKILSIPELDHNTDVVFLRLVLSDNKNHALSRNVYWVPKTVDELDWKNSTWYHTPVTDFADFTSLGSMKSASLAVKASSRYSGNSDHGENSHTITLENQSSKPAVFIRLNLVDDDGADVVPVLWSDNYVTLLPHEKIDMTVSSWSGEGTTVDVSGLNIKSQKVQL